MKNLFFGIAWVLLSAGMILTTIAGLHFYDFTTKSLFSRDNSIKIASAQLGQNENKDLDDSVQAMAETADARPQIIENFLSRYNSPLKPHDYYGRKLVEIADRYEIDFRLLPAIAMQESNLCKVIPEGTYNCLGFGVHSRGTLGFENYESGFERAAKELRANYIDHGLITIELIMSKYTPSSPNGAWAKSVNQWMAEMRYDDRVLGRELREDANVLEFAQEEAASAAAERPDIFGF